MYHSCPANSTNTTGRLPAGLRAACLEKAGISLYSVMPVLLPCNKHNRQAACGVAGSLPGKSRDKSLFSYACSFALLKKNT
nr:MAG TPA: hypothetical protein [Inoviridae sp.]